MTGGRAPGRAARSGLARAGADGQGDGPAPPGRSQRARPLPQEVPGPFAVPEAWAARSQTSVATSSSAWSTARSAAMSSAARSPIM